MASFMYGLAAELIVEQSLDYLSATVKTGLSNATHVPAKGDQFLDDVGSDDFVDGELSGSGYTSGFGNSGRGADDGQLLSKTVVYDVGNTRVELDAANTVFSAIDAGLIVQVTLLIEITNDAASVVLANVDVADTVTNGGDITIQWDAEGIIQLTV